LAVLQKRQGMNILFPPFSGLGCILSAAASKSQIGSTRRGFQSTV